MTCRRVRKLMPLFVGDDLRPGLAAAVRGHIDACPGCRAEFEAFRADMAGIKTAAKAEGAGGWTDGEWNSLVARVTAGTRAVGEVSGRAGAHILRPNWAAASVVGAAIGLAVLSVLFRGPSVKPGGISDKGLATIASGRSPQDQVAITMVSPETGLQVVWILDKNFDWKGDQE